MEVRFVDDLQVFFQNELKIKVDQVKPKLILHNITLLFGFLYFNIYTISRFLKIISRMEKLEP